MKLLLLEIFFFLCAGNGDYEMTVPASGLSARQYSVYFSSAAHDEGFADITLADMVDSLTVRVPAPKRADGQYPRPDRYEMNIRLFDEAGQKVLDADTTFVVGYPSWITEQRFGDLILVLSPAYNGGYTFSSYQWYRNDEPLEGQTREYLYLPEGLEVAKNVEYSVGLVRDGENYEIRSCPMTARKDKLDYPTPRYNYLSVVPSVVSRNHPEAHILCRYEGTYRVYNSSGMLMEYGAFYPGPNRAYPITLPSTPGVYVVSLFAPNADVERERSVRVVVQ